MNCGRLATSTFEISPAGSTRGSPMLMKVKGVKAPKPRFQRLGICREMFLVDSDTSDIASKPLAIASISTHL